MAPYYTSHPFWECLAIYKTPTGALGSWQYLHPNGFSIQTKTILVHTLNRIWSINTSEFVGINRTRLNPEWCSAWKNTIALDIVTVSDGFVFKFRKSRVPFPFSPLLVGEQNSLHHVPSLALKQRSTKCQAFSPWKCQAFEHPNLMFTVMLRGVGGKPLPAAWRAHATAFHREPLCSDGCRALSVD